MSKQLLSPDILRKLLRYEPDTGRLFWLKRDVSMFTDGGHSASQECGRWNTRYAGKEAMTADTGQGYRGGPVMRISCKAHRVIWAIVHGEWPDEIDHINGNRADNRIVNLRSVTRSENMLNKAAYRSKSTGVPGVSQSRSNTWRANIKHNGVIHWLGTFPTFDEAVAVRKAAERQYGFHPNHGRT